MAIDVALELPWQAVINATSDRLIQTMEAFVFSPSNIVIETFHVQTSKRSPQNFKSWWPANPAVQVDSYVVASGKSWILTSIDPFELRDGPIRTPETGKAAFTANAQYLAGADRGHTDMIVGAIFCIGGIIMTAFSFAAVRGISLWAVGSIMFGAIRFFRGLSKRMAE